MKDAETSNSKAINARVKLLEQIVCPHTDMIPHASEHYLTAKLELLMYERFHVHFRHTLTLNPQD